MQTNPRRVTTSEQAAYRLLRLFYKSQSALIPPLLLVLYQRLNKQKEFGYMEESEFKAWAKEAALRRKQCQEGTIAFVEYKTWLDETSLQEKK